MMAVGIDLCALKGPMQLKSKRIRSKINQAERGTRLSAGNGLLFSFLLTLHSLSHDAMGHRIMSGEKGLFVCAQSLLGHLSPGLYS